MKFEEENVLVRCFACVSWVVFLLIGLKLFNVTEISWVWVFAPYWILTITIFGVVGLGWFWTNQSNKKR